MTLSRRSPRPLSLALELARGDWEPETLLAEVQRVWAAAVGPEIAAVAVPERERAGTVTVACQAAVWAQELELMGPEIVVAINRELGSEAVVRLRCIAVQSSS